MFPLKVQRGAVRRGLGAPQAAPGLPKAGRAAGKEGGRRRASGRAGAGRRQRRPPARQEEAAEGWGRRARPPPQDAATMDGGPDPSRPRAGCGAGRPGGAREAAVASRRVALSLRPPPAPPAAPPRSVPGCARRRSSPPWRQWRAAERRRGPRPLPLPPRRVNPWRPLRSPAAVGPGGPHPPNSDRSVT